MQGNITHLTDEHWGDETYCEIIWTETELQPLPELRQFGITEYIPEGLGVCDICREVHNEMVIEWEEWFEEMAKEDAKKMLELRVKRHLENLEKLHGPPPPLFLKWKRVY